MRTRCLSTCVVATSLVAVRATATIMVDDSDPGIEYRGNWVHSPIDDPKDFNYGGSVTFTNATGSTATYRFRGTEIAVFGAFEVAGTFDMHSTYSIDDGPPTDFLPAGTVVKPAYRQKFFQSGTLSDGGHTLVITNNGREFWFDYILVTPPPATTTTVSTAPQQAQTPPTSTARTAPSTTEPATTSSASQPETTQSVPSLSSQAQSTQSFSNTDNVTLTSTDAVETPPLPASSATQSQTLVLASGAASPTSTATRAHSFKLAIGAIAGLAVAGLLVLVLIGLVAYKCCRRRQARRQRDLTPYDPGLTALAFEASGKRDLEHDGKCRDSTATSLLSLPPLAPTHAHPPAERRASGPAGEHSVPHEIITAELEEARRGGDGRTGFEPLGSPSSASPLLPRRPPGTGQQKDFPVTPSAGTSRYLSPPDDRRRSMDGGVRLAGGPPEEVPEQEDERGDDVRSGLSTLPPAYGLYPGA